MKPIFSVAKRCVEESPNTSRIVFAEAEDERVLRAVQVVVDEGIARPILIGRPDVIESRIERLGLRLQRDRHFDLVDPGNDSRYREYWSEYYRLTQRKGVSQELARLDMRRLPTLIGAMLVLVTGGLFFELPLPVAVIGHEGGTLLVVLNGLRLLRDPIRVS